MTLARPPVTARSRRLPDTASSWRKLQRRAAPVRVRLTAAAVAVVAAALVVGAAGMLLLLQRSLMGSLSQSTRLQAAAVGSLLENSTTLPRHLRGRASLVQVLDTSGKVRTATPDALDQPPMARPLASGSQNSVEVLSSIPSNGPQPLGEEGPWLVVRHFVAAPTGVFTVAVATSLDTLNEVLAHLALILGLGVPLLVAFVGVGAWVLAGRALQPVEAIRVEVAELSQGQLHRRVPVPPGADEVARLATTMNTMLERLEVSASRQRGFLADASHELRTPLTVVQAELEVALAHPGQDWNCVAGQVLEETRRMARIVEDLLILARADDGQLVARMGPVDLDELVLDEARSVRTRGPVVDVGRVSAGRVVGDADHLRRVVRNLCDNAVRHASTKVTLELGGVGDQVQLVVADDGPGIPERHREKVFERFARLDESRSRSGGGAGLGLAIVREIVTFHGGCVAVEPSDVGARVVVRLPRSDA